MNRLQAVHRIWGNPLFAAGVFLLLLNDWILKAWLHNAFTGKLSDFAGLAVFPAFFCAISSYRPRLIYCLSGLFFIWWKLPLSQPVIDFVNHHHYLPIGRVVDTTDLWALLVLPISYQVFIISPGPAHFSAISSILSGTIAFVAFCATSPAYRYARQLRDNNQFSVNADFGTRLNPVRILGRLDSLGLRVEADSISFNHIYSFDKLFVGSPDSIKADKGRPIKRSPGEMIVARSVVPDRYRLYKLPLEKDTIQMLQFELQRFPDSTTRVTVKEIWVSGMQENKVQKLGRQAKRRLHTLLR
jgi:hypothetical protein